MLLTVLGVGVSAFGMASQYWYYYQQTTPNYSISIGLRTYTVSGAGSWSGDLSAMSSDKQLSPEAQQLGGRLYDGGTVVLSLGAIGLFAALCSVVLTFLAMTRSNETKLLLSGIGLGFLACTLIIIATVVYARKFWVDASFIVFVGSAFFVFGSGCIFVISSIMPGGGGVDAGDADEKLPAGRDGFSDEPNFAPVRSPSGIGQYENLTAKEKDDDGGNYAPPIAQV